jgi:ubiquinol-cytochrome c reductase cytochrome c1 subunit
MLRTLTAVAAAAGLLAVGSAQAATTHKEPGKIAWSFEGPFGQYDQAQLQRGYKVYREVCAACHSMNMVAFRNLGDAGGPFFDPKHPNPNENPVVKAIAKDIQIADIDDTGQPDKRPGTAADRFPAPFPNEAAARASNGGALPPDMSLLAKAREGGPDYIHAIVTGYREPPAGLTVPAGKYYNPYLPGDLTSFWRGKGEAPEGGFISMPPPLKAGQVTFDDGTPSTLNQEATDVAAFLAWASDPKLEERNQTGLSVMIFLLIFTGLLYATYRQVWRNVAH